MPVRILASNPPICAVDNEFGVLVPTDSPGYLDRFCLRARDGACATAAFSFNMPVSIGSFRDMLVFAFQGRSFLERMLLARPSLSVWVNPLVPHCDSWRVCVESSVGDLPHCTVMLPVVPWTNWKFLQFTSRSIERGSVLPTGSGPVRDMCSMLARLATVLRLGCSVPASGLSCALGAQPPPSSVYHSLRPGAAFVLKFHSFSAHGPQLVVITRNIS